jgi:hypothetical protein
MNNIEELSFCGILCSKCKNYKQNMNCAGCRVEEKLIADCPTRICAREKGFLNCGECDDFPCETLEQFYEDGNNMHREAYQNLKEIKQKNIKQQKLF